MRLLKIAAAENKGRDDEQDRVEEQSVRRSGAQAEIRAASIREQRRGEAKHREVWKNETDRSEQILL